MNQFAERRRRPRVPLQGSAVVEFDSHAVACQSINIAASGIALLSLVTRPVQDLVRLAFFLPNGTGWLKATAKMVREEQTPGGRIWGLQFRALDQASTGAVEIFIRQQQAVAARTRVQELSKRSQRAPSKPQSPTQPNHLQKLYQAAIRDLKLDDDKN